MGNVFDQMAGQPQQPNQPAAQTSPASSAASTQAPPASGNVFDTMATQQTNPPVSPVTGADQTKGEQAHESDTMDWLKKVWGSATEDISDRAKLVGDFAVEHTPQAALGPLGFATHKIIEPYNESMAWAGKTSGELAEKAMVFGTPLTVEQAREQFPRTMGVVGGLGETVGGTLADPRNWPLMAGKLAKPILNRLMSAAFAAQMGSGVKDQAKELAENWDNMSPYDRWHAGTQLGLGAAMTVAAATHAGTGEAKAKVTTPISERGTVAGERTTLRPTTVKTAGVEAPIPASKQANPNVFTKMAADVLAKPGAAAEFQKELTKPAATKQAISTLSQVATDKIAAHDALSNGEATPAPITGTQTAGEHTTPDEIWPEMQKSAGATWQKARDASAREQDAWKSEREAANKGHQAGIDHYNELVEAHNADPANADNQLQPQTFNADDVDHRDRPQTYDELKAALDAAKDRTGFNNPTDVREKAKTSDVPKAEKAMDSWFRDHADEVSPDEYDSAKKLWADSERFKEISNNLRPKLAKGTLTGNDIRGLEAVIDGKAITRRGPAGIGEFKRLLGPEGTENLQNIAKLFDPFEKNSPLAQFKSWGMTALKSILAGGLGYEYAGPAGAAAAEGAAYGFSKLMNSILFNPELGKSFSEFVEATKNAVANGTQVSKDVLDKFKGHLKDLWSKEHGELEVPGTGKMGTVGNEPKPSFNLQDNGTDENGDKNHILAINHDGEHVGHLNISQKTPDSWTVNDSTVRPDMQGKGLGTQAYQEAFKQAAAKGMSTVESDISTTKAAAKTWRRLSEMYPDAITEENGQFVADLSKIAPKEVFPSATERNANASPLGEAERNPVASAADEYNQTQGRPALDTAQLEPDARREKIADAFDKMEHNPSDPKVKAAYKSLIDETKAQKKFLESKGYTFDKTDVDPYKSYEEMRDDVKNNKHLSVWTGGNPLPEDHPLGKIDKESGWRNNDIMRGVHDVMGHVAGDNDFSEKGEENAYNLHRQTFSEKALPALTTETKGQTSWFFNNKDVRSGKVAPGNFPDQKAGLLPEHLYGSDAHKNIASLTNENGGATYNPAQGDLSGTDAYAVPMFRDLSRTVEGDKITPAQIKKYMDDPAVKAKLVADPKLSVGTWVNDGQVYLDLSAAVKDRAEAIRLGKVNGQKAITNLKNFEEIPVGGEGTGTPLEEDTGFNPGELDQQNAADEAAYRASLSAHEVATRQPYASVKDPATGKIASVSPPNDPSRLSGLAALEEANNTPSGKGSPTRLSMKQKLVAAFAGYEGTGLKLTQDDINNPDQAIEKIVNHIQDNYQWTYDQMPQSIKDVAQQWYETVHNSTRDEAEKTGLSHPQVAGVVAAFSPQNPWDNNRESAYKLIDLVKNQSNHVWSPEMDTALQNIKDVNTSVKPGAPGLTSGQAAFGKTADAVRGKKFTDFNAEPDKEVRQGLQALWLRVLDEAHTEDRSIPTMNPNGEINGHAGTRAWPSLDVMARGLDIIENGMKDGKPDYELINQHLGGGNKVRNFYNNMINPWSERGHFTADTHQVGAGLLQAISSKSTEAMHNFGSGNVKGIASPGKNGPTGVKGTYPVYQEAGVRAAAANGVRPNQFQSMSWEGIRSLLGDDKKTPALEQAIRSIWEQHENGELSKNQARQMILEASGGFTKPEWMSQETWDADPSPNKEETVLANRPADRTPEAITDAAKTRKVRQQMEQKAQKKAEQADKAAKVEQKAKRK